MFHVLIFTAVLFIVLVEKFFWQRSV